MLFHINYIFFKWYNCTCIS